MALEERALEAGVRSPARSEAAAARARVAARQSPESTSIGRARACAPRIHSGWARAVARAGQVLVRRNGRFAILDRSQPPAAYREGSGFNRDFVAEMLEESVSEDDANNAWKPNVGVVMVDFLVRHGVADADDPAFLDLVESLRGAECR